MTEKHQQKGRAMTSKEMTYTSENQAQIARRRLIRDRVKVSLIGYDPNRRVFVFDIYH